MPLDEAIGIAPQQQSSEELVRLGCLLSLVMPYELASWMLSQWSGLAVSASSLWNWVQLMGSKAQAELAAQLEAAAAGTEVPCEPLKRALAALPLEKRCRWRHGAISSHP